MSSRQQRVRVRVADGTCGTVVEVDGREVPRVHKVVLEHEAGHGPRLVLEIIPGPQEVEALGEVTFDWAGQKFTVADVDAARSAGLADLADRLELAMGRRLAADLLERVT